MHEWREVHCKDEASIKLEGDSAGDNTKMRRVCVQYYSYDRESNIKNLVASWYTTHLRTCSPSGPDHKPVQYLQPIQGTSKRMYSMVHGDPVHLQKCVDHPVHFPSAVLASRSYCLVHGASPSTI
jgi:hypothetical protein